MNPISLMLCYRLCDQLQKLDILKKYSAKDALYYLRDVRVIRIHGAWQTADATKIQIAFARSGCFLDP